MIPRKVTKGSPTELLIEWDDGHRGRHTMQMLRTCCPCAACKTDAGEEEKLLPLPVLTPGQFELRAIQPVGNYALQLTWADGHQTGIYSYQYLRQLCECGECLGAATK